MITTTSWWDTVDSITPKILGKYLNDFPSQRDKVIKLFLKTNNMWLHRSCIIFQLKSKEKTDQELLFSLCRQFAESTEFFIQKTCGWKLRQQAYLKPEEVYRFVDQTTLSNLTKQTSFSLKYLASNSYSIITSTHRIVMNTRYIGIF
jgi:3-methyladenine DNA glycosylase AlkD